MRILFWCTALLLPLVAQAELDEVSSLTRTVAKQSGASETQTQLQIDRIFAALKAELLRGRRVTVFGFGTFAVESRRARKKKNELGNAPPKIRKHVRFRASDSLALEVNR